MPTYIFQNPETQEYIEVVQRMSEEHTYVDDSGLEWSRVWTVPKFNIDTKIDPNSYESWRSATENKDYTMGEMWEMSGELSQKRTKNDGQDAVAEQWKQNYSKKRMGAKYSKEGNLTSGGETYNVDVTE